MSVLTHKSPNQFIDISPRNETCFETTTCQYQIAAQWGSEQYLVAQFFYLQVDISSNKITLMKCRGELRNSKLPGNNVCSITTEN